MQQEAESDQCNKKPEGGGSRQEVEQKKQEVEDVNSEERKASEPKEERS